MAEYYDTLQSKEKRNREYKNMPESEKLIYILLKGCSLVVRPFTIEKRGGFKAATLV
jgi:hypothetical protein